MSINDKIKPELINSTFYLFEYLGRNDLNDYDNNNIDIYKNVNKKKKQSNKKLLSEKYKNKLSIDIIDTILIDNNEIRSWLFTDKNGFVLNHSTNKLNKQYIVKYYLNSLRNFFNKKGKSYIDKFSDKKIIDDLEQISVLIVNKLDINNILERNENLLYLKHLQKIYFILITYEDEKKLYHNIIEFYKILYDNTKFATIKLIQNLIDLQVFDYKQTFLLEDKIESNTFHIIYSNDKYKKDFKIYLTKFIPTPQLHLKTDTKGFQLTINSKKTKTLNTMSSINNTNTNSSTNYDNKLDLTLVTNTFYIDSFKNVIFNLINFIEKNNKMSIKYCKLNFIKLNTNNFAFVGGYSLFGIQFNSEEYMQEKEKMKLQMKTIMNKKVPIDIQEHYSSYKKFTEDKICKGEFCNYNIIPKNFSGTNYYIKSKEFDIIKKIPSSNRTTNRDQNYNLPDILPYFKLKRCYDNPILVNNILKIYDIYPKEGIKKKNNDHLFTKSTNSKNINNNKNIVLPNINTTNNFNNNINNTESTKEYMIYTPSMKKLKFLNRNYDSLYEEVKVCHNCFLIYNIIDKYIDNLEKEKEKYENEKISTDNSLGTNKKISSESNRVLFNFKNNNKKNLKSDMNRRTSVRFKTKYNNKDINQNMDIDIFYNIKNFEKLKNDEEFNENINIKNHYINKSFSNDCNYKNDFSYINNDYSFENLNNDDNNENNLSNSFNFKNKNLRKESYSYGDLEKFINVDNLEKDKKYFQSLLTKHKNLNKKKNKVTVTSVYYKKNYDKSIPYYLITSDAIKLKNNMPTNENPIHECSNIKMKDYSNLFDVKVNKLLEDSNIFIYDNYTAIPYKTISFKKNEKKNEYIFFILNDFFESYDFYYNLMNSIFKDIFDSYDCSITLIFFNLPGQSATIWSNNIVLNNLYYSNILDRFIFFLMNEKKIFNSKCKIFFIGFGNGAQIALTYLTLYEKNFNMIKGAFLISGYISSQDKYISNCLNEIKHYLDLDIKEGKKIIDNFFDKNNLFDNILNNNQDLKETENGNENENEIKLNGYYSIINGFNYNFEILKKNENLNFKIPIIFFHSLINSLYPIKNIITGVCSKLSEEKKIKVLFNNKNLDKLNINDLYIEENNIKIILLKGNHNILQDKDNKIIFENIVSKIIDYNIHN